MTLLHGFERSEPRWKRELRYMLRPEQRRIDEVQFMSRDMYERIARFPIVHILPPFDAGTSTETERCLAWGLSRQLMRNLMLVRNMSIRGPEDSSWWSHDQMDRALQREPEDILVTGVLKMETGFRCDFELHRREQKPQQVLVQQRDFRDFLESCTQKLASALKAEVTELTEAGWKVGQPMKMETLLQYGELIDADDGEEGDAENIEPLWEADPAFSIGPARVSDDKSVERLMQNRALQHDAFNAQLMWQLSMSAFDADLEFDMLAFRFKKRAVELSPGHGKAHMCLPHSGANDIAFMLPHSWLAYYLLPDNAYAVNNLLGYMRDDSEGRKQIDTLIGLCSDAIRADHENPDGYRFLLNILEESERYEDAMRVAEELMKLYAPDLNPRTRRCMELGARESQWLADGWDPAKDLHERMDELRAKITAGDGRSAEAAKDDETSDASDGTAPESKADRNAATPQAAQE